MARAKKTRNVLRYYCIPQKLAFRTKRFNYSPSCAMKTETRENQRGNPLVLREETSRVTRLIYISAAINREIVKFRGSKLLLNCARV